MNTLLNKKKEPIDKLAAASGRSLGGEAVRRMLRSPVAITGGVITGLFLIIAIFAPLLEPKDPNVQYLGDQIRPNHIPGAQAGFPLGVDDFGRDFLSRMIAGAQQTLIVGVLATLVGVLLGVIIGGVAGAFGGWVDTVLMRLVDVMLSFPSLLLAISIAALFAKPSQWTVILAVSIIGVPIFARLLRGSMLAQREADHVLAATSLGVKRGTIVFRHAMIFPDARASASQCEALLNLALEACEHYYPAFQFVLWGGKTAEDAIAAAVLECAGRA